MEIALRQACVKDTYAIKVFTALCRGGGKCKLGVQLDILGKTYSALCACDLYVMRVTNPDEADFEMIKKFIAARRQSILDNAYSKWACSNKHYHNE